MHNKTNESIWQGRNRRGDREKTERERGEKEEREAFMIRETQRLLNL